MKSTKVLEISEEEIEWVFEMEGISNILNIPSNTLVIAVKCSSGMFTSSMTELSDLLRKVIAED